MGGIIRAIHLLACGLLAVSGTMQAAESTMSLDGILQKNHQAVMAASEIGRIESLDKTLSIVENGYSLLARYRATINGHMRIDVFADGDRVFSEGKDDAGTWEWPGGQPAPADVTHDGVAALDQGIEFNLFPLADLPGRGHRIELVGEEVLQGKFYYVLKVTLQDGFKDTWLVEIARDVRALHPGIDATRKNIETRFDQFERRNGILSAGRSQNYEDSADQPVQVTQALLTRYNLPRALLNLERSYVPAGAPVVD